MGSQYIVIVTGHRPKPLILKLRHLKHGQVTKNHRIEKWLIVVSKTAAYMNLLFVDQTY